MVLSSWRILTVATRRLADTTATNANSVLRAWSCWALQVIFWKWREVVDIIRMTEDMSSFASRAERLARLHEAHVRATMLHLGKRDELACLHVVWCGWREAILQRNKILGNSAPQTMESQASHNRARMKKAMKWVAERACRQAHFVLYAWCDWIRRKHTNAVESLVRLREVHVQMMKCMCDAARLYVVCRAWHDAASEARKSARVSRCEGVAQTSKAVVHEQKAMFFVRRREDATCLYVVCRAWHDAVWKAQRLASVSRCQIESQTCKATLRKATLRVARLEAAACVHAVWCSWRMAVSDGRRLACVGEHKAAARQLRDRAKAETVARLVADGRSSVARAALRGWCNATMQGCEVAKAKGLMRLRDVQLERLLLHLMKRDNLAVLHLATKGWREVANVKAWSSLAVPEVPERETTGLSSLLGGPKPGRSARLHDARVRADDAALLGEAQGRDIPSCLWLGFSAPSRESTTILP